MQIQCRCIFQGAGLASDGVESIHQQYGPGYGNEERGQLELGWVSKSWQGWGQHYLEYRMLAWPLGDGAMKCGPRCGVKKRSQMHFSNVFYLYYV